MQLPNVLLEGASLIRRAFFLVSTQASGPSHRSAIKSFHRSGNAVVIWR